MKIVMLKDVGGVGRQGEVKEVADGYALNALIPRGLAEQATKEALAAAEKRQAARHAQAQAREEKTRAALKDLDHKRIVIRERANKEGHLFRKIKKEDIAGRLSQETSADIDSDMITMTDKFLQETGEYVIKVTARGAEAAVTVVIEALSVVP